MDRIRVTINKSHLATLGERLYVESVELFRELISNAYDADATEVYVRLGQDAIVVEDNGSGMNRQGLEQYFNIGSPEKKQHSISPRFGRKRIGQFGIGKFAVLSAADEFSVESRKGNYVYQVVFNKADWQKGGSWELPMSKEPATALHIEGTKVSLTKLKRTFSLGEVEKYLRAVLPLRAKKFKVFLNGKQITPKEVIGRHISFRYKTMYGEIEGEIIVAHQQRDVEEAGLECRVKGVLIKRSLFGIDPRRQGVQRITGWVEAPFLTLTSSRTEFVRDQAEYKLFEKLMRHELEKVLTSLKKEVDKKELAKMQSTLKDVLEKLRQALKENPDLAPSTKAIARKKKDEKGKIREVLASARLQEKKKGKGEEKVDESNKAQLEKDKPEVKELPEATLKKRFRVAKLGVTCGFAHLGEDGPAVISEGSIIYINQDYPLYLKLYPKRELLSFYLLQLITQELVLMKRLRLAAREAYETQLRLIKDALIS